MVNFYIAHGHLVFKISDSLTFANVEDFIKRFEAAISEKRIYNIVIDVSSTQILDSSVLATLVNQYKRLSELGGYIYLVNVSPAMERILDTTGISKLLRVYPSLEHILAELDELEEQALKQ